MSRATRYFFEDPVSSDDFVVIPSGEQNPQHLHDLLTTCHSWGNNRLEDLRPHPQGLRGGPEKPSLPRGCWENPDM